MPAFGQSFESPLPSWIARSPVAGAASALYAAAVGFKNGRYDRRRAEIHRIDRPVISVGGIRAGGSGKTPVIMLLVELLEPMHQIAVLSRGYKRTEKSPVRVSPEERVDWELVGDEPAMIRSAYPKTWLGIGADRYRSALGLKERMDRTAVFLLDDGFQHRKIARDLDIVCVHDTVLSDRLLPRGYLRESLDALSRAHLLMFIDAAGVHESTHSVADRLLRLFPSSEPLFATMKPQGWVNVGTGEVADRPPLSRPAALSGIARPDRFFNLLSNLGIVPCRKIVFPDHHRYSEHDFISLRELYSKGFVTTEKDAARLKGMGHIPLESVWYLKVRLSFSENGSLYRFNQYIKGISL